MAKASVTINVNNVFALSNWTSDVGRFFVSLQDAVKEGESMEPGDDAGIVEMELQVNEFAPVRWYGIDGTLIKDDEMTSITGTQVDPKEFQYMLDNAPVQRIEDAKSEPIKDSL